MSDVLSASSRIQLRVAVAAVTLLGAPAAFAAVYYGQGGWLTLLGAVLIFAVATTIAMLLQRLSRCGPMPTAVRRYMRRFLPAMLAYVVVLFGSLWSIRQLHPQGPLLWLLAVAPAVPIAGAITAMGLYLVEETDEFLRAVLVQSMLWGIGAVMVFCTAWGFLENVALVPHLPVYLVFPIFCGAMGLAQPFVRLRYR